MGIKKITIEVYRTEYTQELLDSWLLSAEKMSIDGVITMQSSLMEIIERTPLLTNDELERLRALYKKLSIITWRKFEQCVQKPIKKIIK